MWLCVLEASLPSADIARALSPCGFGARVCRPSVLNGYLLGSADDGIQFVGVCQEVA
jgi:hypothetical protein